jgi:hypothetical protein
VTSEIGTGSCETIMGGCNNIDEKNMCNTPGASSTGSCIWVSGETTKCQEVKSTCSSVVTQPICETLGASSTGSCIWVPEETRKCQEVQTSCDVIEREKTCLTIGSAVDLLGNKIECVWLKGKADTKKSCIAKVYSILFSFFYFLLLLTFVLFFVSLVYHVMLLLTVFNVRVFQEVFCKILVYGSMGNASTNRHVWVEKLLKM